MELPNLVRIRKHRGLTQRECARAFGVSVQAWLAWEKGDFSPNVDTIVKMARFFGCTSDFILGLEKGRLTPSDKDKLKEAARIIESKI